MANQIKRIPVTDKAYKKASSDGRFSNTKGQGQIGIQTKVTVGAVNASKTKVAGYGSGDQWHTGGHYYNSAYRSSYANAGNASGAFGDIPLYFALMNENNGGLLYWPVNLKEKYDWYRYFYRVDPFVGGAIDLNIELPLSKLMLKMPKMKDEKRRKKIQRKYERMCKDIKMFEKFQSILMEYFIIGNVFLFMDWDETKKSWSKMIVLPPEEVQIFKYPFSDYSRVEYRPELIMSILKKINVDTSMTDEMIGHQLNLLTDDEKKIIKGVPKDLLSHIKNNGAIVMDTDPYSGDEGSEVGSFVYHLARRKTEYFDLGVSILERVLVPLLMKENYKYTQLSLASRNMTPRNKISAPNITPEELGELREQIDLSMLDPDYSIVTNFDWSWELIGADQRLIDLSREYETIENQLFAGLGVTRELLTGEGMYSGGKITVEILNTRYLLLREILINMVEENFFKPMADANEFYDLDDDGEKVYLYPKLSFNRLSIRDNNEVFDSLFQLYQKGSLPVDVIYELFNLDSTEAHEKLKQDMFTVKDSTFNTLLQGVYNDLATKVTEQSDIVERMVNSMTGPDGKPLTLKKPEGEQGVSPEEEQQFDEDVSEDETVDGEKTPEVKTEEKTSEGLQDEELSDLATTTAQVVKKNLPPDATPEQITQAVDSLKVAKKATAFEVEQALKKLMVKNQE